MYVRQQFRDPLAVLAPYVFEVNHSEEEAAERKRNIERTAPSAGVGFVRQQGEDSPQLFRFTGTILTQSQKDAMDAYYEASQSRTIFFRDFTDVEYEVLFTDWNPTRKRAARNTRDPVNFLHYWTYSMELEVIG
jgi:hypothetical protein